MPRVREFELIFFKVIEDLKDYLPSLILVGGWLPYVYVKYLWKNLTVYPIATVDIDFGFEEPRGELPDKTIFQTLSRLDYREQHYKMDRPYPVVLLAESEDQSIRMPVEFITTIDTPKESVEHLIGRQILVNRIENFEILLEDPVAIEVMNDLIQSRPRYTLNVSRPESFCFHKGVTFVLREGESEKSKDLYYLYYILRFYPAIEKLYENLRAYRKRKDFPAFVGNLMEYFSRPTSQGCLWVEKENGPDEYIVDLRNDIFQRFRELIKGLEIEK